MTTNPAASIAKGIAPYDPDTSPSLYDRMIPAVKVVEALDLAGFPESEWATGVAIARRESALVPELIGAVNAETREVDPANASWDFGLFQISYRWNSHLMQGPDKIGEWDDPQDNAKIAKFLYDQSIARGYEGWRPWHTYTSGNYRVYLEMAREAVEEYKNSETYDARHPTRPEDAIIEQRDDLKERLEREKEEFLASRYDGLKIETQDQVGIRKTEAGYANTTRGVVIHHPGSDSLSLGDHENCHRQVRGWDSYHRSKGWNGIGYSLMLCHHGILMLGRGLNRQGAHAPGANSTHVGLLIMVENGKRMTVDQRKGLLDTLKWLRHEGVNSDNVTPHSFWVATSCPGDELRGDISDGVWRTSDVPPSEEESVSDNDDKVTVDGILGEETISALQRALNEGVF